MLAKLTDNVDRLINTFTSLYSDENGVDNAELAMIKLMMLSVLLITFIQVTLG